MNKYHIQKKKRCMKKLIYSTAFLIILFLFFSSIILNLNFINKNFSVIIMFIFIEVFSICLLIVDIYGKAYSITMLHWFFCFIFYGVAAFVQYSANKFLYFSNLDSDELVYVCLLILVWMFFYYVGTITIKKDRLGKNKIYCFLTKEIKVNLLFVVFSTIVSMLITFFIIYKSGFKATFSRATANIAFQYETLARQQLITTIMRNLVLYGLAISIVYYKKNKNNLFLIVIQFICCTIVNSPFGLARFNVAVVYIGLLLLIFPKFKKKKSFIFLFFVLFVIAFPMINIFRQYTIFDISLVTLLETIHDISHNFLRGDYDAFTMIIYTKKYINDYGLTYGYQLLGPLLFFVPRAIWPQKPIGSGALVLETYGHSFTNGSSPLIAEGLINFGFAGVIMFAFIMGKTTAYLDGVYWKSVRYSDKDETFIATFYPFALSLFFFMFRGDLLSTFAYFVGHVTVYFIMFSLNNYMYKKVYNS